MLTLKASEGKTFYERVRHVCKNYRPSPLLTLNSFINFLDASISFRIPSELHVKEGPRSFKFEAVVRCRRRLYGSQSLIYSPSFNLVRIVLSVSAEILLPRSRRL